MGETMRLYHGSNVAIEHPIIARNTGFADLGKGFYLTPDHEIARSRATARARREGGSAVVSVFELDEGSVPWVTWGKRITPQKDLVPGSPFGLQFDDTEQGYAAWASYIKACRAGTTTVPNMGFPAIVRAWLATMEIEMVYAGFMAPDEFAQVVEPAELIVQYCILDQRILKSSLRFIEAEVVGDKKS